MGTTKTFNAARKRDLYPLFQMDECINSHWDVSVFSTLDADSGYSQVEVEATDREKMVFMSHHVSYRFVRMAYGSKHATGTIQRAMDVILSPNKWQFALGYFDDIVIFSCIACDHNEHVKKVLSLSRDAGLP